jgi:hypothetical protein
VVRPESRRIGATVCGLDYAAMLYVRFLIGAGGALLVLMFAANALLPQPAATTATRQGIDHPAIRITSTRKGPERVVIDTSLPTTFAPTPQTSIADGTPPATRSAREAFAQLPAEPSAPVIQAAVKPAAGMKPLTQKPARRHVAARRSPEP